MDIDITIDNPLNYLVENYGYSQQDLADLLEVSQHSVSNWMKNFTGVREKRKKFIFNKLNCSYEEYKKTGRIIFPDGPPSLASTKSELVQEESKTNIDKGEYYYRYIECKENFETLMDKCGATMIKCEGLLNRQNHATQTKEYLRRRKNVNMPSNKK